MQLVLAYRPVGGLDTDSDNLTINSQDYRDAINIRNAYSYINKEGTATNVKGNVLVDYTFNDGDNKVIGTYEDTGGNTLIFFVWNSNNEHKILRYFPDKKDIGNPYGVIEKVIKYDFGWGENQTIDSIDLVDGKLLYWVDPKPRKINIEKANITGKKKSWQVYVPDNINTPTGATFFLYDENNSIVFYDSYSLSYTTREQYLQDLYSQLVNSQFANYLEFILCNDCSIEVKEISALNYRFATSESQILIVPDNWYGLDLTDRMFDRIKYPPVKEPYYYYEQDSSKNYNYLKGKVLQFRTQYHYDDNEDSKLSPISKIAIENSQGAIDELDLWNKITIKIKNDTDVETIDAKLLTILKKVSLFVREGNEGEWRKIWTKDICGLLSWGGFFLLHDTYYGDITTTSVPALLQTTQYDRVPIEANASKFVNNRLVDGGVTDDYDIDECIQIEPFVAVEEGLNEELITIRGRIYILSQAMDDSNADNNGVPYWWYSDMKMNRGANYRGFIHYNPNKDSEKIPVFGGYACGVNPGGAGKDFKRAAGLWDVYDQRIPEGGFPVYIAGSNIFTISKQVNIGVEQVNGVVVLSDDEALNADVKARFQSDQQYIWSEFEIKVPRGIHTIRLASHYCSFGDKIGKGDAYDLNKSLWQKTSTYVLGHMNFESEFDPLNESFYHGGVKEIVVDTTSTPIGQSVFAGSFIVKDLVPEWDLYTDGDDSGEKGLDRTNVVGYVYDDYGSTLVNDPTFNGIPVCLASIEPICYDIRTALLYVHQYFIAHTDHNGFFFAGIPASIYSLNANADLTGDQKGGIQIRVGQITNNPNYSPIEPPVPILPYYNYNTYDSTSLVWHSAPFTNGGDITIIKDRNTQIYKGNLQNIIDKNCNYSAPYVITISGGDYSFYFGEVLYGGTIQVVCTTDTTDARANCAARFYGNVDTSGVVIVVERQQVCHSLVGGDYEMYVWGDMTTNIGKMSGNSAYQYYYQQFNSLNLIAYYKGQYANSIQIGINYFTSMVNWDTYPKEVEFNNSASIFVANYKAYKRGGKYQLGIRYYDSPNRSTPVLTNEKCEVYIPFITEDLGGYWWYPPSTYLYGLAQIGLFIDHAPPIWATHYQIMITKRMNFGTYLQFKVNEVKYLSRTNQSSTDLNEIETTEIVPETTHFKISIENLATYFQLNNDSKLGYSYTKGDRLRLIFNQDGTYYNGLFDYEVVSWESPNWLIIKRPPQDIKSGSLIEVYSPKSNTEDKIFYECGEMYPCTNPNQPDNAHSFDEITLGGGDTYWRQRAIPVFDDTNNIVQNNPVYLEDASISDFYISKAEDIGRIGVTNDKYSRVYKPATLRVSDNYIPNSKINGLSSVESIDDKDLGVDLGDIQRLMFVGDVLLSVHKYRLVSNYIGRVLAQGADNGLLAITNEFIGSSNRLQLEVGTQHPQTIKQHFGFVYGFDHQKGMVWRYSNAGVDDIRVKTKSLFNQFIPKSFYRITAGVDKMYGEYLLTLSEGEGQLDGTYAFSERKGRWIGRYSFYPEAIGSVGNTLATFMYGALWVHDVNDNYNYFYGYANNSKITIVANQEFNKVWLAMGLNQQQSDNGNNWEAENIINEKQESRIKNAIFVQKEDIWWAEFKRDLNSAGGILNGKPLRSQTLQITLSNNAIVEVNLDTIFIKTFKSL